MARTISIIGAVGLGGLAGYVIGLLPIAGYWRGLGALLGGWVLASVVLAASWVLVPPRGIEVLAVSIGLGEAVVSFVGMLIMGSVLQLLLAGPLAALLSPVYRAPIMGLAGAVVAVLSFSIGVAGVHAVT